MISYDRVFEIENLTTEMIIGKQEDEKLFTLTDFMKKMLSYKKNCFGNIFVKYLEPIEVAKYLKSIDVIDLNESELQRAAF